MEKPDLELGNHGLRCNPDQPQISIIMPAFNAAGTIRESIESALHQTCRDFELLVTDDGSSDDTLKIADSIGDSRVKVIRCSHAGAAAARNHGIARARGEFICFLDADDLWAPTKLERQLDALRASPESALAYGWSDLVNQQGGLLFRGGHVSVSGSVRDKLFVYNFIECGSNPMVRRIALDAVGWFDEKLIGGEDWDLWQRIAARYPFVGIPETLVYYRMSEPSLSANVEQQAKDCLAIAHRMFAALPEEQRVGESRTVARLYRYLALRTVFAGQARNRLRTICGFAYSSFHARPSLSVIPFLCILSTAALLFSIRAHRTLYRITCLLPQMPI